MAAGPDDAATAPPSSDSQRSRATTRTLVIALVAALVAGVGLGVLIGSQRVSAAEDGAEDARDRASEQEDAARDRRDLLDARIALLTEQVKTLVTPTTSGALQAGAQGTAEQQFSTEFSVDGATYTVHGVTFVDEFESAIADRPAPKQDGRRWALVDVDVRNDASDMFTPACGTVATIRLVDERGRTWEEQDFEPPVPADTSVPCGTYLQRGKSMRWVAPLSVPDDVELAGIHVADVYGRSTDSPFNVVRGKAAWIPFDEAVAPGKAGDDPVTVGPGREDEE